MNVPVGVALVAHGDTASRILEAARGIVPRPNPGLDEAVALDAGSGVSPSFRSAICDALERLDRGRGVVVLVDLLGSSPCQCAQRQPVEHDFAVLSGLNLAMLLKLANLDLTTLTPGEVAEACADSGRRSVSIWGANNVREVARG